MIKSTISQNLDPIVINTQLISMLFDYLKINFFILDKEGYYLAKNNAYVVPNADRADQVDQKSWDSCLEVIQTGESQTLEETYQGCWYLSIKAPLKIDNEIKGVIGISIDITELKRAQVELQETLQKLDGMTAVSASIAHELRTPLATINMAATNLKNFLPKLINIYEIAEKNDLVSEPISPRHFSLLQKLPEILETETSSAFTFIDMLLMKIKPSLSAGEIKNFSIKACIDTTLERYPFSEGQRELVMFNNQEDFLVKGNEILLTHIIFNLLKNALHYIAVANKGNISLWMQHNDDNNQLFFKDTGTGIAPEILPRIFDRFFTQTQHGAGVGLAFCKMAMDMFEGDIVCESVEGEYTLFILTFPIIDKETL
jgi:signal transduction histidine kinase